MAITSAGVFVMAAAQAHETATERLGVEGGENIAQVIMGRRTHP